MLLLVFLIDNVARITKGAPCFVRFAINLQRSECMLRATAISQDLEQSTKLCETTRLIFVVFLPDAFMHLKTLFKLKIKRLCQTIIEQQTVMTFTFEAHGSVSHFFNYIVIFTYF